MASSTDPELIPIAYRIPFDCGAEIVSGYLEKKKCPRGSESKRFYGHFECSGCGARWNSSNTWQGYTQGCKKCRVNSWPIKVYHLEQSADTEVGRPHLSELCEKCLELGHNCHTGGDLNDPPHIRYHPVVTRFDQCYKKQYQLLHYDIIIEPSFIRNLYDAVWDTLNEMEREEFQLGLETAKAKWVKKERSDLVEACQEVLYLIKVQNYPNRPISSGQIRTVTTAQGRLVSYSPARNTTPDEQRPKSSDHCRKVIVDESQSKVLGSSRKVFTDENRSLNCRLNQTEILDVIRPKVSSQSQRVPAVRGQPKVQGRSRNVSAEENRPMNYKHGQIDASLQKVHSLSRNVISDEGHSKYLSFSENVMPNGNQSKVLGHSRKVIADENRPVNCRLNQAEILDVIRPKSSEHNRRVPADACRSKKDNTFIRNVTSGESRPISSGHIRKVSTDVIGAVYYKPAKTVIPEIHPKRSDVTRKVLSDKDIPVKYGRSQKETAGESRPISSGHIRKVSTDVIGAVYYKPAKTVIPEIHPKRSDVTRKVLSDKDIPVKYGRSQKETAGESRPISSGHIRKVSADVNGAVYSKPGRTVIADEIHPKRSDVTQKEFSYKDIPVKSGQSQTKFLDESRWKTDGKTSDVISKSGRGPLRTNLNRGSSHDFSALLLKARPDYPDKFKKS